MQIRAETYIEGSVEKLRRCYFDGRQIEIAENIDQWHGPDYCYFKVRGRDGSLYILRREDMRDDWQLTMYQRRHSNLAVPRSHRHVEHFGPM